jgi:hypothetical protein
MNQEYIQYASIYNAKSSVYDISHYEVPLNCTEPTLKLEKEENDEFFKSCIHLKYVDNGYVLHCDYEAALTIYKNTKTVYFFYLDGHNVHLEDLPIDGDIKVVLKLKLGDPLTNIPITYQREL